jgi:hypothetical protein
MKTLALPFLALFILSGCSSESSPPAQSEKPQAKPPEFITGRSAFQKLYIAARGWAPDVRPYQLQSQLVADSKGKDGKASLWRAGFASPLRRSVKPYIWSGTDAPDAPAGVNAGTEDTYNPNNSSTQVFEISFLKVDSDKALEVALAHGGGKLLQTSPDTPVFFLLDWNRSTNQLIWHVIYGTSREEAKLRIAVDATTGNYLHVEK